MTFLSLNARSKKFKIVLIVVGVLILFRIALPYIILHFANKNLANMKGYYGHIDDIDLALYRGAYMIDHFYLNKIEEKTGAQTPFMSARKVDLSIEWRALFKGRIVGELVFDYPVMAFSEDRVELNEVSKDTSDFRKLLRDFMPIDINNCELRHGTLSYVDKTRKPQVDLAITNVNAIAKNLRNVYKPNEVLPSTIEATGNLYHGSMHLSMKLNPLADHPTLDLNAGVEKMQLPEVNNMFKSYGGFDVSKGTFSMYSEVAAKDGKFIGYVKPLLKDVVVLAWEGQDKKDSFFQKLWEGVIDVASEVFENQKKGQVAAKINFSGPLNDPKINILQVLVTVLQNAFIKAIKPTIDNQINLNKVNKGEEKKGLLKALFNTEKKEEKAKKPQKKAKKPHAQTSHKDKKSLGWGKESPIFHTQPVARFF